MPRSPRPLFLLVLLLPALGIVELGAQDYPAPYLPGILQDDPAPMGCVSCHIDLGGGKDFRLNKVVELLPKHPDITKAFKGSRIPDSCILCHREGSKLGSLGPNLHRVHYAKLGSSAFVRQNAGSCLDCHWLDEQTGAMNFKSGPANW